MACMDKEAVFDGNNGYPSLEIMKCDSFNVCNPDVFEDFGNLNFKPFFTPKCFDIWKFVKQA